MMAAIAAAESGASVMLFERQKQLGRKLAASGGGRCNLTNTLEPATLTRRFGPRGRFMIPALQRFSRNDLLRRMQEWGVPCAAEDGFHYFPVSQCAEDILKALEYRLRKLKVQIRLECRVEALDLKDGKIHGLRTDSGSVRTPAVVVAAGGVAWPALGGCSLGYTLAQQAGHDIVEPTPALVGLTTLEKWPHQCAGVTLPEATAWMDLPGFRKSITRGILLFTHDGVSGPLILDLSGQVTTQLRQQPSVPLKVCLQPDLSRETWRNQIEEWRIARGKKTVRNLVGEIYPHSLAFALCDACGLDPDVPASRMTAPTRDRLIDWLTAVPLTIIGSAGLKQAMVTRGGVALKEIDPATLQSRRVQGLFFAGEILDLDGPCGGYNLQWAFSSGGLAGYSAAVERARK